jgi:hypothetical protein
VPPPGGAHVLVLSRKIWSFRRVAEVADVAHELKDKWDIVDVVNRYTRALDTRDWDMLAAVFTEDGGAEFDVLGIGHRPTPQAVVDLCRNALQDLTATQHLQGNHVVEVDGDTANAVCYMQATHFAEGCPGGDSFIVWSTVRDQFVRTPPGLADQAPQPDPGRDERQPEPLQQGRRALRPRRAHTGRVAATAPGARRLTRRRTPGGWRHRAVARSRVARVLWPVRKRSPQTHRPWQCLRHPCEERHVLRVGGSGPAWTCGPCRPGREACSVR